MIMSDFSAIKREISDLSGGKKVSGENKAMRCVPRRVDSDGTVSDPFVTLRASIQRVNQVFKHRKVDQKEKR